METTDVLICGSGSAGLCAAAWLARCGINFIILDRREGPMERGQADGVQCRTVEVFESFGVVEELLRASYHLLEIAFWSLNQEKKLVRTNRSADTEPGLSHMPHVILNQALLNQILLDYMNRQSGQQVAYGHTVKDIQIESAKSNAEYPVLLHTEKDGHARSFRAKYALVSFPPIASLSRFIFLNGLTRAVMAPTASYVKLARSPCSATAPTLSGA